MSKVSNKKNTQKKLNIKKFILVSLLVIFLVCFAAFIGVSIAVVKSSPAISSDILNNLKQSSKIYDMNGNYIEDYSDSQVRNIVSLKQIPQNLQNSFISIEDERFYQHHGIDIKRILGSLLVDLKLRSFAQGGSTITQQLVKNAFLTQEKKITRKLQEAYMSVQLERKLSKEQILEAYLNTIYLGGSSYGVEAATLNYFGKDVKDLTLGECAFLAGLNQSPGKYYPYSKKNFDPKSDTNLYNPETKQKEEEYVNPNNGDNKYRVLYNRRDTVLAKMLELNYITKDQHDAAVKERLVFKTKKSGIGMKYQWFIEPALDEIAKDFSQRYGIDPADVKQKLRVGGYSIYLTIDPKIQEAAESVINDKSNYAGAYIPKKYREYTAEQPSDNNPNPQKYVQPQAAAVIYDYATGQMRAIVGGRGDHPRLSINRATDVPRQPGSSIKPLAVYGPSIDTKLVTAATIMQDSPMPADFVASHNGWNPHNYETNKFTGNVSIRNAIKNSINIVAIKLANMLNPDPALGANHNEFTTSIDYLQNKFHLSTIVTKNLDPVTKNTSPATTDMGLAPLALGALTEGVYPYEMAAAYGVFANNGVYTSPVMYTKVVDNMGNTILESTSQKSQSISPEAAYIMVDLMKGVVNGGTGTRANLGSMPAAGKTGTATEKTNLWFCGVTPYYSGAVWIGHDKQTIPLNGLASSNAANIWGKIMKKAHQNLKVKDFVKPSDIVTAPVCTASGFAPADSCYKSSRVVNEIFIPGTEPIQLCPIHNKNNTNVNNDTNSQDTNDFTNPIDENNNDNTETTTIPGVDTLPPSH